MRKEVAARLDVTVAMVCQWEKKNWLTTVKDPNGRNVWFSLDQVIEFQKTYKKRASGELRMDNKKTAERGEAASAVFKLIRDGRDFVDIVIETKYDPALVRQLMIQYSNTPDAALREEEERKAASFAKRDEIRHDWAKRQALYQERRAKVELEKAQIAAEAAIKVAQLQAGQIRQVGLPPRRG